VIRYEQEIFAMNEVFQIMKILDRPEKKRILRWIVSRFRLKEGVVYYDASEPIYKESIYEVSPGIEKNEIPKFKEKSKEKPESGEKVEKLEEKAEPSLPFRKDLEDYDTVLDILEDSGVAELDKKILLIAAFLQVRFGFKGITSYDITFRLKRVGRGIKNPTNLFPGILQKDPPLVTEIETGEGIKRSRKKYQVTEEGLKLARGYLAAAYEADMLS
jgi:hypothetical protein